MVMSALLLGALLGSAADGERIVYRCQNLTDQARFALTYERDGSNLRDITVGHYGIPRLGNDLLTTWRGRVEADGAVFHFREGRRGSLRSGEMRLLPIADRQGAFRLTWSSSVSGGDLVVGEEERSAECVHVTFEQASPAS